MWSFCCSKIATRCAWNTSVEGAVDGAVLDVGVVHPALKVEVDGVGAHHVELTHAVGHHASQPTSGTGTFDEHLAKNSVPSFTLRWLQYQLCKAAHNYN